MNTIEIVPFTQETSHFIKLLNYEWLEKYFRVEDGDKISLSDPKKHIIDNGGFIYYAKLNGEIVGTYSLLKEGNNAFQLGKMAVTKEAQRLGIGTILLEHSLKTAREKATQKIILYSNTKLQSAIRLYKKYGFYEVELEEGLYERANIKMEKIF